MAVAMVSLKEFGIPTNRCRKLLSRLRLSLRSLVFLVLVLGATFGWIVNQAKHQRAAVATIKRAGGEVAYDWQTTPEVIGSRIVYHINLEQKPIWPEWLVAALGIDVFGSPRQIVLSQGNTDDLLRSVALLSSTETLIIKRGGTPLTNTGLAYLRRMTRLKSLLISGEMQISKSGLENLEGMTDLRNLAIYGIPLSDDDLIPIGHLTSLETLCHYDPHLEDAGLEHLADLSYLIDEIGGIGFSSRLTNVGFIPTDFSPRITDIGLSHLKGLVGLRALNLSGNRVTTAGLIHLKGMKRLEELWLLRNKITDIAPIRNHFSLCRLHLSENPLNDTGVSSISELRGLQELALDGTRVTDEGLSFLGELPLLTNLTLSNSALSDFGLAHVAKSPALECLDLSNTRITDMGLMRLKSMKHLKEVGVSRTQVTAKGIEAFVQEVPQVSVSTEGSAGTENEESNSKAQNNL
jgi:Leucine-rich repeat (LRR) protein